MHAHGEALVLAQRHAEQARHQQREHARRRRQLDQVGEAGLARARDRRRARRVVTITTGSGQALVGADGGQRGRGVAVGQHAIEEAHVGAGAQPLEQLGGVARGDQAQVATTQQVAIEVARRSGLCEATMVFTGRPSQRHSGSSERG